MVASRIAYAEEMLNFSLTFLKMKLLYPSRCTKLKEFIILGIMTTRLTEWSNIFKAMIIVLAYMILPYTPFNIS